MSQPFAMDTPAEMPRRAFRPWLGLALALAWVVLVRVPLVVNAGHHLDSDLAVDGLTLIEALRGQWRWHYPGTPYMGVLPVLLSYPQALAIGAGPAALVSGGVAAYGLVLIATFLLARRAFGPSVAAWALVPLAFASTGTVWLSGRITGGHLLAVAWHAGALWLFHGALRRGGVSWAAGLGLWCGLGIYLDGMLAFTTLAIVSAGIATWTARGELDRRCVGGAVAFVLAFAIGYAPRIVGTRVDPYDAYGDQFATIFLAPPRADEELPRLDWEQARSLALQHGRLLALDCLPRLIAGHRLPGYQAEPDPATLDGRAPTIAHPPEVTPVAVAATWLALALALAATLALVVDTYRSRGPADVAVRLALLGASALVLVGFLVNRNIYNSDNYRYLVLLLVPWALGFGILMRWLAGRGSGGLAAAGLLAAALAVLMTLDTRDWYARFGWVEGVRPVRVRRDDPALAWLRAHPEVDAIFGDYWDVYRLGFLTGGRVRGVPYPNYPDRFPEWSAALPGGRPRVLIARPGGLGPFYERSALRNGARALHRTRGLTVYDWP